MLTYSHTLHTLHTLPTYHTYHTCLQTHITLACAFSAYNMTCPLATLVVRPPRAAVHVLPGHVLQIGLLACSLMGLDL